MLRCGSRRPWEQARYRTRCRRIERARSAKIAEFMPVDVNRLRSEGVYEAREPVAALTDDLNQVQRLASDWHARRKNLAISGALTISLGIIAMVVFVPVGLLLIGG